MLSPLSPPMPPPLSSATTTSFGPFSPNKYIFPSSRLPTRGFLVNFPRVLCSASKGAQNHSPGKVDRRDVLIGLGSLYGASTLLPDSLAFAVPLDTPRISIQPTAEVPFGIGAAVAGETGSSSSSVKKPGSVKFPITLNSVTSTEVKRPKKSRSKKEKEEEEEVLVINGISFDPTKPIKFDVLINDGDGKEIGAGDIEFAGSFVNVPHSQRNQNCVSSLALGISQVLEDLEAEDDESMVVTLVPRLGIGLVTIGGIGIEFYK